MTRSAMRRRDVLFTLSGGYVLLAGCADSPTEQSGYGTAYGAEYGSR